jgi:DNA-3-methyladenine glycosylase II
MFHVARSPAHMVYTLGSVQRFQPMPPRLPPIRQLINAETDIRDGIKALRRKCPAIRRMHDLAGDPPLRRREPGFEGLARIVVSQQVSVASATAIWGRFADVVRPMEAAAILARSDEDLRGAGLSRPKIRTLRAISTAIVHEGLALDRFDSATDEAVHEALTRVSGIGPWTADIFLMACMGRADAFAAGDLALQEAARLAFELESRPDAAGLLELAERWRPWRSVAARLLWAYYKVVKEREGITS